MLWTAVTQKLAFYTGTDFCPLPSVISVVTYLTFTAIRLIDFLFSLDVQLIG